MCVLHVTFPMSRGDDAMAKARKDDRIDLRVKDSQKGFLIYAANLLDKKLSTFVLDSAIKEAEELIAQNVHFALPEKQWKAFCAALDAPAKEIPQLKKLLAQPGIFNERKSAA